MVEIRFLLMVTGLSEELSNQKYTVVAVSLNQVVVVWAPGMEASLSAPGRALSVMGKTKDVLERPYLTEG